MPKPKNPAAVALGSMTSRKKTLAARANGAKGGFWATKKGIALIAAEKAHEMRSSQDMRMRDAQFYAMARFSKERK